MSPATRIFLSLNRNGMWADHTDSPWCWFWEDVRVTLPDGTVLWFGIEYQCDKSGNQARARLQHNPVARITETNCHRTHLLSGGQICIGSGILNGTSPYSLEYAVGQARQWCRGYVWVQYCGYERACREISGWRS